MLRELYIDGRQTEIPRIGLKDIWGLKLKNSQLAKVAIVFIDKKFRIVATVFKLLSGISSSIKLIASSRLAIASLSCFRCENGKKLRDAMPILKAFVKLPHGRSQPKEGVFAMRMKRSQIG